MENQLDEPTQPVTLLLRSASILSGLGLIFIRFRGPKALKDSHGKMGWERGSGNNRKAILIRDTIPGCLRRKENHSENRVDIW
jgi:hypothetical protein